MTDTIEAKLGSEKLTFRAPTQEEYDRFTDKLSRDQKNIGDRELLQATCTSHDLETLRSLLHTKPAAIAKLAGAIDEELSGVSLRPVMGDDSLELEGVVFGLPDLDAWESLQNEIGKGRSGMMPIMRSHLVRLCTSGNATELFEKAPGCVGPVMSMISEMIGGDVEIEVKKG